MAKRKPRTQTPFMVMGPALLKLSDKVGNKNIGAALFSTKEAAEILGISVGYLQNQRSKSDPSAPPYVQVYGKIMYRKQDLLKYIADRNLNNPLACEYKLGYFSLL